MRPFGIPSTSHWTGAAIIGAIPADEELHRHSIENLDQADALLFGRVTYEMMEAAFRPGARRVASYNPVISSRRSTGSNSEKASGPQQGFRPII